LCIKISVRRKVRIRMTEKIRWKKRGEAVNGDEKDEKGERVT
jgi:hypothetical protein